MSQPCRLHLQSALFVCSLFNRPPPFLLPLSLIPVHTQILNTPNQNPYIINLHPDFTPPNPSISLPLIRIRVFEARMVSDLNHKDTELRLGLPGTRGSKRASDDDNVEQSERLTTTQAPATKAQVVGWPPIRSYRKNSFVAKKEESSETTMYVKVSMDGAPFLRKIDINVFKGYPDLIKSLESMFKFIIGDFSEKDGYKGSEFVPTYEDKDGDWMLVGDVPWEMFNTSCKRLRIMKGSEAKGLACCM